MLLKIKQNKCDFRKRFITNRGHCRRGFRLHGMVDITREKPNMMLKYF